MTNNEERQQTIFKTPVIAEYSNIYIYGEITEPKDYINEIVFIREANESDLIKIRLNTPGGNLFTALAIIAAMNESAAHIITVIDGECCSAGTLIFLNGKEFEINPSCSFMVHTYSSGTFGKGHEIASNAKFHSDWFTKIAKRFYTGFLSEKEITDVIEGKDLWMDAEEVSLRCSYLIENAEKNSLIDDNDD